MAKTKASKKSASGAPSKSQQARDYKAANPNATTQEVATATGMSYNAVYQALKNGSGKKGRKGKRGRKPKAEAAGHENNGKAVKLSAVEKAMAFVEEIGDSDTARMLIERVSAFAKKVTKKLPF